MHKLAITKFIQKSLKEVELADPSESSGILINRIKVYFESLRLKGDLYIAWTPPESRKQYARVLDSGYYKGRYQIYVQLPSVLDLKYFVRQKAEIPQKEEKYEDKLTFQKFDISCKEEEF